MLAVMLLPRKLRRAFAGALFVALAIGPARLSLAQTPDSAALADSAKALRDLGMAAFREQTLEGAERAIALWTRSTSLYREAGDLRGSVTPLSNIGIVYQRLGQADSALVRFREVLASLRELGDRKAEATTLNNIGTAFFDLGRPDSVLVYFRQALTIIRELNERSLEATTLNNIGSVYQNLGQSDSALVHFRQALPILRDLGERDREGSLLSNLGVVHQGLGRPDSALHYFRQALPIARQIDDRLGEGIALNNIGEVHQSLGWPDSSLVYFRQALPVLRAAGDGRRVGGTLHNIGGVFRVFGRPDSSLAYYRQALTTARELTDRRAEASTLNGIAVIYENVSPDSALAYHRRALSIRREIRDRSGEGSTLGNIGKVYGGLGQPDSALVYYRQALSIRREVKDRGGEGYTLHSIGVAYADFNPDSALSYYLQALPLIRQVGDRRAERVVLGHLGHLHHRRLVPPDLAVARDYYDSSAVVQGLIAEAAGSDPNRLSFAERDVALFEVWTLAWLASAAEVGRESAELSALASAERGRGQALLELMRDSAEGEAGQSLSSEGRELAAQATRAGATGLSFFVGQDTLVAWLMLPSGEVRVARQATPRDSVAAWVDRARRGLGVDAAAVRSRLARSVPRLEAPAEGEELSRGLEDDDEAGGPWPTEAALRLSELLVPQELRDLLPDAGELVIVPHGALNQLPFAALPLSAAGEPLGSHYAIRYAPSLAILGEAQERALAGGDPLVVGNPTMPEVVTYEGERVRLDSLPGAETEAAWLAGRLGQSALGGPAATESAVRSALPEAAIVHLATHGYAYATDARARDSWVALAPDADHDGLLTVGEVLDELPELQADLVVLSACQTGLGDLKQAEGTVGLQRAFLAKGTRSVLVSLWSVSDEATRLLMQRFYTHWLDDDGPSKAEALRRAQEDVRATEGFEHPRYWAAFQLVGAS